MTKQSRKPTPSAKARQTPAADQPSLARIHDLASFAAISIPPELRQILGEEEYESHIKEMEAIEIGWIIRVPKDVVYLRSRVVTVPFGGQKQVQAPDPQASKVDAKAKEKGTSAAAPRPKQSSRTPAKSARKPRGQA
ncbi:hypothetical protein [Polaromonas sp. JS666]|uniref:hypothetical protein n=1 Tax=Polaromonas sp. (strain JS666 / ATCC BAA-500) TaxID=296591 RepID=UPI0000464D8D|nr:hypothetical protein [Polaromonas sp. JS666]ABE42334.1 hypothetical protein Bpro_0370 [Polaromonas sp. JS666]